MGFTSLLLLFPRRRIAYYFVLMFVPIVALLRFLRFLGKLHRAAVYDRLC